MQSVDLTLHERANLTVPAVDFEDFINEVQSPPYAWADFVPDICRQFPGTGLEEIERWVSLSHEDDFDEAFEYAQTLWADAGERPFNPEHDALLIDLFRRARDTGEWQPSPEVCKMIDAAVANEVARQAKRTAELAAFAESESERLDTLYIEARNIAREHPHWLNSLKEVQPEAFPFLQAVIGDERIPQAETADAIVDWVKQNIEWDQHMNELRVNVSLGAEALRAEVSRAMFSFTTWQTNAKTGIPDPTNPDNVYIYLRMIGAQLRWNAWQNRAEISERDSDGRRSDTLGLPRSNWQPLTDAFINRFLADAGSTQKQFRPAEAMFRRTLFTIAHEATFDPVLDRINSLVWDGVPRLDTWLSATFSVAGDLYHQAVGRNVIGGIVKRARTPGVKHDEVMMLVGAQGTLKSAVCQILALQDDWFTDSVTFDGSPQNVVPQLFGKLVIELAELGNMGRRDVEHVKAFIARQSDNYTAKYQALATDNPRRCIFVATTNNANPLSDETGNRRWLPVRVEQQADTEWLRQNVEQLVAEAAQLHKNGENFGIPREIWSEAGKHQEAARSVSPVEDLILKWFDRPTVVGEGYWITSTDIGHALRLSGQSSNAKYGAHLKKLGYSDENIVVPMLGKRARVWVRSRDGKIDGCMQLVPVQRQPNGQVEMQMQPMSAVTAAPPMPERRDVH